MKNNIRELTEISSQDIRSGEYYLLASDKYSAGRYNANHFITKDELEEKHKEFIDRINNIDINSFVIEWNKGKKRIVDAIRKFGVNAEYTDSFDELAEKIKRIPIKAPNQTGIIPWTFNNTQTWDLLQELYKHPQENYPYRYGVLIDDCNKTVSLTGADAYYTSDGALYTLNTTHTFKQQQPGKINRYIIYYFKNKEYTVTVPFVNTIEINCFNGIPKFVWSDTTKNLGKVISYTDEEYEATSTNFKITNTPLACSEMIFNGITICQSGTYGANSGTTYGYNIKVSLPKLKEFYGAKLLDCQYLKFFKYKNLEKLCGTSNFCNTMYSLISFSLNKLKEIKYEGGTNGGYFISCGQNNTYFDDKKLNLPELEVIENTNFMTSVYSIREITLPKLKRVYNAIMFNSCAYIEPENIHLPSLEYFGGTLMQSNSIPKSLKWPDWLPKIEYGNTFYNMSSVTEVDLENLKVISRGLSLKNFNAVETLEFTGLKLIDRGALIDTANILTSISCPNLEEIIYTSTNTTPTMSDNIIQNCPKLIKADFPQLKQWYTGNLFTNCPEMTEINLPELEYANSSSRVLSGNIRANKITINLPKLKDTANNQFYVIINPRPYMDYDKDKEGSIMYYNYNDVKYRDSYIIINLGSPKEGNIILNASGTDGYFKNAVDFINEVHIQKGFRSSLNISAFNQITYDNLIEILQNLEDNTEYETKNIVFGTTNLKKLLDDDKLIATNKNYKLS